jgi:hypothetical protein
MQNINTVIVHTDKHLSRSRLEVLIKRVTKAIEKKTIELP